MASFTGICQLKDKVYDLVEKMLWITVLHCVADTCTVLPTVNNVMLPLDVAHVWLVIYDTVSRLHCESESFKMDLILDVNTQIYPVDLGLTASLTVAVDILPAQFLEPLQSDQVPEISLVRIVFHRPDAPFGVLASEG